MEIPGTRGFARMMHTQNHIQTFNMTITEDLYDLSMLEEMDDNEYVLEILSILLLETPKGLKEMKEALFAGKADIVSQKAHNLKSSASIIQAGELTGLLTSIETIGKKGTVNNELIFLVETATHEYSRIEKSLKRHIEELK